VFGRLRRRQKECRRIRHLAFHFGRRGLIVENWLAYSRKSGFCEDYAGHLRGQDQEYLYRIARSIAREHTFAIESLVFQNKELAGARGRDGLFLRTVRARSPDRPGSTCSGGR
jgi:hypothetical protein